MLIVNKQEYETLKEYLPPDTVVDSEIGTDAIVQGVEKSRMFERKELKDLFASIRDGRIFEQLKEMSNNKEEYEPFVIVEGLGFYYPPVGKWVNLKQYLELNPTQKMGFYETQVAFHSFGVGLITTTDKADTCLFLTYENTKLGEPKVKREYPERRGFRKDWDNAKKREYLFDAFGHQTGKALLAVGILTLFHWQHGLTDSEMIDRLSDVKLASGRRIGKAKADEVFQVLFN